MTLASLDTEGWKIVSPLWMGFCEEWVCLEQRIPHVGCPDNVRNHPRLASTRRYFHLER